MSFLRPVPNRYFGARKDGTLKVRGIETRRHDTPKLFKDCQTDILNVFASCISISDVKNAISEAKSIQKRYKKMLFAKKVPISDLALTNKITKGTNENTRNTIQADVINQLKWEGKSIDPGQKIKYVLHDYSRKKSKRGVPIELTTMDGHYDANRYSELLDKCCQSVIEPFEK